MSYKRVLRQELTNIYCLCASWRDFIFYIFVFEEVELPEGIEEEISKILIHVDSQDPTVKAIYNAPTVHHLMRHCTYNIVLTATETIK